MGTYGVKAEELLDKFEDFLREQEGDISADTIAKCWNLLSKKYEWKNILDAIEQK